MILKILVSVRTSVVHPFPILVQTPYHINTGIPQTDPATTVRPNGTIRLVSIAHLSLSREACVGSVRMELQERVNSLHGVVVDVDVDSQYGEMNRLRPRRGKRDKVGLVTSSRPPTTTTTSTTKKRQSKSLQKHKNDAPTGGMQALLPSLLGLAILACGVMAKLGFRGRATVCGIDLGTTNSVVCVQSQTSGVGIIECIADPATGSPIVPSVVSFLEASERTGNPTKRATPTGAVRLNPPPSHVVVGAAAKKRIDSHPHHTLYHAKRVLGRPAHDPALAALAAEVEFGVHIVNEDGEVETDNDHDTTNNHRVEFRVPDTPIPITPRMVGSYVVSHLRQITEAVLGHANVQSAVICVPAKFNALQRQETVAAFVDAGLTVTRIVEEPTAAALAYGLHRKAGVDYILVYDFGGGTLDVSLLHVSDGYVDVMGSDGDDRLGGTDFDVAIAHYLLDKIKDDDETGIHDDDNKKKERETGRTVIQSVATILQRLQETEGVTSDLEDVLSSQCPALSKTPLCTMSSFHTLGEQLKIELSEMYSEEENAAVMTARAECLGLPKHLADTHISTATNWTIPSFCSSLQPVALTLSSAEFNRLSQSLLDRSISPVVRLLADLDLKPTDIDEIVMVGGTTRMPQIRHLVQAIFPDSPLNVHIDPDITVAYGAASIID